MDNVVNLNAVPGPAAGPPSAGELSDAELEFVVGGLTRVWMSPPPLAPEVPALPTLGAPDSLREPPV
jgi:hypothetical protein